MTDDTHRAALTPGYRIQWYEVQRILGQGGFGITYLALDTNLNQQVAIKEYLPMELAVRVDDRTVQPMSGKHGEQYRWGLTRFIEEARTLARFKHPNIVRVFSVFEANNTAYMVMEYEHGDSLQSRLSGRGTLDETALLQIVQPLLSGLEQVHAAGFIHRDIKPANIFLRNDGTPVLLDFGSARQATGQQTKTLTSLVSSGFAPFEQYYSKSDEQGPWTDIYGLAATMYRCICGRAPTDAVDRSRTILESNQDFLVSAMEIGTGAYSERLLKGIDHGLEFHAKDRPQTIAQWRHELGGDDPPRQLQENEVIAQTPTVLADRYATAKTPLSRTPSTKAAKLPIALVLTVVLILAGAAWFSASDRFSTDTGELRKPPSPVVSTLEPKSVQPSARPAVATPPLVDATPVAPSPIAPPPVQQAPVQQPHPHATQISRLLQAADEQRAAGKVLTPPGDNALNSLRTILSLDPDNQLARKSIRKIFVNLLSKADRNLRAGDLAAAQIQLDYAETITPNDSELALMRIALRDAQHQQALRDENRRLEAQRKAEAKAIQERKDSARQEQARRAQELAEKNRQATRERERLLEQKKQQQARARQERAATREQERLAEKARAETLKKKSAMRIAQRATEIRQCRAQKNTAHPEPARSQGSTLYFAALAVGNNNSWGEAAGYTTRAEAEINAINNCSQHGKDCKIQVWSNDCVAFARGVDNASGWSWGATIKEASRKAIGYCEERSACCTVKSAYCADEVQ